MGYTIEYVQGKTNYIRANHRNKKLLVSTDINVTETKDGKTCATFQNQNQQPTVFDMLREFCGKRFESTSQDCSVIIDNPSDFQYCIRENGEYILFGGGVTFNGTEGDDKLTMYESQNATVNLGNGNDTVRIADVNGFPGAFNNNTVNTGNGNDTVTISGNFDQFKNNKFFLGKGNDAFKAEIKPESTSDGDGRHLDVSSSSVYATDGKRGWFEKDSFESETFRANELRRYGFEPQNITQKRTHYETAACPIAAEPSTTETPKAVPEPQTSAAEKAEAPKANTTPTKAQLETALWASSVLYYTTGETNLLESAWDRVYKWYEQ